MCLVSVTSAPYAPRQTFGSRLRMTSQTFGPPRGKANKQGASGGFAPKFELSSFPLKPWLLHCTAASHGSASWTIFCKDRAYKLEFPLSCMPRAQSCNSALVSCTCVQLHAGGLHCWGQHGSPVRPALHHEVGRVAGVALQAKAACRDCIRCVDIALAPGHEMWARDVGGDTVWAWGCNGSAA